MITLNPSHFTRDNQYNQSMITHRRDLSQLYDRNRIQPVVGLWTPILVIMVLVCIYLFGDSVTEHWDWQLIGVALITTAVGLLLFHFYRDDDYLGFRILTFWLSLFGTLVYLRDEIWQWIDDRFPSRNIQWTWEGSGYYALLGLISTVFVVILSFRTARIVSRTTVEKDIISRIARKLDILCKAQLLSVDGRKMTEDPDRDRIEAWLELIDAGRKEGDLEQGYRSLELMINESSDDINNSEYTRQYNGTHTTQLLNELDSVYLSKLRGRVTLAERSLLLLLAFTIGAIVLSGRVAIDTKAGLIEIPGVLVDLSAILFTASVGLMATFNIFDMERQRERSVIGLLFGRRSPNKRTGIGLRPVLGSVLNVLLVIWFVVILIVKWNGL